MFTNFYLPSDRVRMMTLFDVFMPYYFLNYDKIFILLPIYKIYPQTLSFASF